MGKYFEIDKVIKIAKTKRNAAQSRTFLWMAEKMQKEFPKYTLAECLKMIIQEWRERKVKQ